MIALIRKNLRLWGYGKSLALFTGCILFSISGRLNGGIAYERHILSAVSDHYYLTYFVLPIVLLLCHNITQGRISKADTERPLTHIAIVVFGNL